uniref:XPG N-terminal domain-containing protein n=1 Tax=viral metagenome TaxID=1070528 RepID=A0A6C0EZ71_9ZZZZ
MGIRMLNKFLQEKCKDSISCIHLSSLSGKKIVVDISIYLYKFLSEGALLENLYLMISIFREHNITPIFIFDGKPPAEKNDTIAFRKKNKKNAREEYYRLKQILDDITPDVDSGKESDTVSTCVNNIGKTVVEFDEETSITIPTNSVEICNMMERLKKKFVILKSEHIQNAKTLLQAYGMTYYESPGEADMLCAKLVSKNIVYACLSEDTDMFVYGCNRVLRYVSLTCSTAILYEFQGILKTLDMDIYEFRQLCIMFGCDYLPHNKTQNYKNMTIFNSYKMFKKYKEYCENINENVVCDVEAQDQDQDQAGAGAGAEDDKRGFYNWLLKENNDLVTYIQDASKIIDLFDITHYDNLQLYDNVKIINGPIDYNRLIEVMEKENFIFMNR